MHLQYTQPFIENFCITLERELWIVHRLTVATMDALGNLRVPSPAVEQCHGALLPLISLICRFSEPMSEPDGRFLDMSKS